MLSIKSTSLIVLVLQTSIHVLLVRYSRTVSVEGVHYLPSTIVVLAEVCKVVTCILIIFYESEFCCVKSLNNLKNNIIKKYVETVKLLVPSCLYVVQNNLLFVALTNLDAATYQITYQLKILTTAIFAVVLLGKKLTYIKWLALILLITGVALIQLPAEDIKSGEKANIQSKKIIGIICVLTACFSSGFAGVYFEKLLKGSVQSIWIRNIQLGIFGIIFGICTIFIHDLQQLKRQGFFQGYNKITWLVIMLQVKTDFKIAFCNFYCYFTYCPNFFEIEAFGGLTVSLVIKYADNILKSFAASISIIFSTMFSYYILNDLMLSRYFVFGAFIVIISTFLYGYPIKTPVLPKKLPPSLTI